MIALAAVLAAALGAPLSYECLRAAAPVHVDGKIDDPAWQRAPWSSDFIDIEGDSKPRPKYRTRVKMLWDDRYLYIAAELEEPDVKATLTQRDSVIFKDNDFEVFLKPLPATKSYYEFEINALNTGWDLFLPRPYSEGGQADNSWDIEGLQTAIGVQGTLNDPRDKDKGWTVEMAIPLTAFAARQKVPQPRAGTTWRINFSRVQWTAGKKSEDNWVWSPQGVVNMHVPERWGFLHFSGKSR
ncbi:carbohydrate-binding family 9-like protein [Pseudoduganella sp.]|uniref:carbohydrate-binding family 9-like protein n=1 Tax=Pseudoduganella sp. TaxID=1880898 RepID=UPI0035ADEEAA